MFRGNLFVCLLFKTYVKNCHTAFDILCLYFLFLRQTNVKLNATFFFCQQKKNGKIYFRVAGVKTSGSSELPNPQQGTICTEYPCRSRSDIPFLFIKGNSCPRSVQTSLTQYCLMLTVPRFLYSLLSLSCGDIGFKKKS